jgi:hypothetical protein
MFRLLLLVAALAVTLSACSQNETRPTPAPTPCAEPTRGSGDAAFDDTSRATWRKELDAKGPAACDSVTNDYIARLDQQRGVMMLARASTFAMYGRVTDAATGAPVDQVCVTPGKPGTICWARTDADGWYLLDLGAVSAQQGFFEIFFTKSGYPEQHSVSRMLSGRAQIDYQMKK